MEGMDGMEEMEGIEELEEENWGIKRDLKYQIIVLKKHSFLSNKSYFGDIFNYPTRINLLYLIILSK